MQRITIADDRVRRPAHATTLLLSHRRRDFEFIKQGAPRWRLSVGRAGINSQGGQYASGDPGRSVTRLTVPAKIGLIVHKARSES